MRAKVGVGFVVAVGAAMMVSGGAGAAGGHCPSGPSGWTWMSVEDAAGVIYDGLVEPKPPFEEFVAEIGGYDADGDGVCLAVRAQSNPRANWFESPLYLVKDNNTSAG